MNSLRRATVVLLCATVLLAATVSGRQSPPAAPLPESPGSQLLQRACSTCHDVEAVTRLHFPTRNEYADIVTAMVGAGAVLTPQEVPVLVDYLFDSLGTKSPAADEAGKAIVEKSCTTCHGADLLKGAAYESKEAYKELVDRMVTYGASVAGNEMPALLDFLFKTYAKK